MKRVSLVIFSLIVSSTMLVQVLAITGSIGNARMILNAGTGEEIEKYVLVKNVNEVPVGINISVSGDLAGSVKLKDSGFKLNAGEEKKAYFTIKPLNPGTTETKINVAFTPESGQGVGLSSTVIVVAEGEAVEETAKTGVLSWLTGSKNDSSSSANEKIKKNASSGATGSFAVDPVSISLLSTTATLAILIVLLAAYSKKIKKKREIKPKKNVEQSE